VIVGYAHRGRRYHTHNCPYAKAIRYLTFANLELARAAARDECGWCERHPDAEPIEALAWPRDANGRLVPQS
jgi:hypothetical protein